MRRTCQLQRTAMLAVMQGGMPLQEVAERMGCDECYEQLDRFAELVLSGKNAAEALPLVQDHLERSTGKIFVFACVYMKSFSTCVAVSR